MRLDGALADAEPAGDLLVGQPLPDQAAAPRARAAVSSTRRRTARRAPQQLAGGPRVQRRLAAADRPDAGEQVLGVGVLEQVADRAGVERRDDPLAVGERRQHQHLGAELLGDDPPGRLDAVDAGHLQVHHARRRAAPRATTATRLRAVGGLPTTSMSSAPHEQLRQPGADDGVVVDEHHPDRSARVIASTSRRTVVPCPGPRIDVEPAAGLVRPGRASPRRPKVLPSPAVAAGRTRPRRRRPPARAGRPVAATDDVERRGAARAAARCGPPPGRPARPARTASSEASGDAVDLDRGRPSPARRGRRDQVVERRGEPVGVAGRAGRSRPAATAATRRLPRSEPAASAATAARLDRCPGSRAAAESAKEVPGEVLDDAVVQVAGDPAPLGLGGVDRGLQQPLAARRPPAQPPGQHPEQRGQRPREDQQRRRG